MDVLVNGREVQGACRLMSYRNSPRLSARPSTTARLVFRLLPAETEKLADEALSVKPGCGESFRDRLADGQPCPGCPEMVVVPAGSFMMGPQIGEEGRGPDERVQRVTFARAFAVGKFEVTFAEWDACVTAGGCGHRPNDRGWGRGRRPVIDVTWHDAKEYVAWLSRKTGKTYRLPNEAEWEYAARAGTTTRYAFGDTITRSQAQFSEDTWGSAGKTVEGRLVPGQQVWLT